METDEEEKKQEQGTGEAETLGRKEFLKKMAIGLGAIGLGVTTGEASLAAVSTETSNRIAMQGFLRFLLENPSKADEFLQSPERIAEEHGVRLAKDDVKKIEGDSRK